MASSAPWMWAASSLIRRDDELAGGTPTETGLWMRMRGLAFLVQEHGLRGPGEACEEIVMANKENSPFGNPGSNAQDAGRDPW